MKRFTLILFIILGFNCVYAQDGRHLSLNFDLEQNSWKLSGQDRLKANCSFADIQYFHYGNLFANGVLFDVSASGFLSTLQGNNYQPATGDTTEITNSNILSLNLLHFFNENNIRFGFVWGVDFLAKYLTKGSAPGSKKSPEDAGGIKLAEVAGLGIPLGIGFESRMLDGSLVLDGRATYYLVYNSQFALSGSTFQAKGIHSRIRVRYYLNDLIFFSGQVLHESLDHQPLNPNNTSDLSGNTNTFRIMIGAGIQFGN